jgi:hypothetical protein
MPPSEDPQALISLLLQVNAALEKENLNLRDRLKETPIPAQDPPPGKWLTVVKDAGNC